MKLKNVLLATKQTALELYRQNHDDPKDFLPADLLERKKEEHEEHYRSFNIVKKTLDKYNIGYQRVYMPYGAYEEFENRDLVISIGGDGTVLNSAHYILDKTPLLTLKSEGDSVGALCKIVTSEFEDTLIKILKDDFRMESWTRVEGRIGHKTDMALNEIAVVKYNGLMVSYGIDFKGQYEEQRSSRILVSTGAGSTGWYHNVHDTNDAFSATSKELRFTVSEALRDRNYGMLHGCMGEHDVIEITSLMDFEGCISFDGDMRKRAYDFPIGQKLQVRISDKPLNVIIPK
jgi:hypothetical protein